MAHTAGSLGEFSSFHADSRHTVRCHAGARCTNHAECTFFNFFFFCLGVPLPPPSSRPQNRQPVRDAPLCAAVTGGFVLYIARATCMCVARAYANRRGTTRIFRDRYCCLSPFPTARLPVCATVTEILGGEKLRRTAPVTIANSQLIHAFTSSPPSFSILFPFFLPFFQLFSFSPP